MSVAHAPPGRPIPPLSGARLAWLQATHRRGRAAALWLCLAAAIALPAFLLLVDAMAAESGLAQDLDEAGGFSVRQDVPDVDAFNALDSEVDSRVTARTGAALVPLGASVAVSSLHVQTVRNEPPAAELARRSLTAVYRAHLASHVNVVAGDLPPEGLAGGETAASMALATADQLALRLSDRICGDFTGSAGAAARWCLRIVALWQPRALDDPYWAGTAGDGELALGRYDLFALAQAGPTRPPTAAVRYWASPDAVTPDGAAALAGSVAALAADLSAPQRRVDSQLAGTLRAFADRRRVVSGAIDAVAAVVAVLGLAAVALVAGRLLDGEQRELALLRARGWPRGRAWLLAVAGLGAHGAIAACVAIVACALVATALTANGSGLTLLALRPSDAPRILAALGAVALALIALLAALAARSVWPEPEPSLRSAARRRVPARLMAGAAAVAGIAVLVLPRFTSGSAAGALLAAPALGVCLLAAAASLRPPAAWVRGRSSVPGVLAELQLRRRPGQHAGAAFALTLATTAVVFAAVGLVADPATGQVALGLGLDIGLATGAVAGLVLALAVYGLHFRSAARRRVDEYRGLLAHGLPPGQIERSLAGEQAATAGASLLAGGVLSLVLALTVLPPPPPLAVVAGITALLATAIGTSLTGALARRLPARLDPLPLRRQAG